MVPKLWLFAREGPALSSSQSKERNRIFHRIHFVLKERHRKEKLSLGRISGISSVSSGESLLVIQRADLTSSLSFWNNSCSFLERASARAELWELSAIQQPDNVHSTEKLWNHTAFLHIQEPEKCGSGRTKMEISQIIE